MEDQSKQPLSGDSPSEFEGRTVEFGDLFNLDEIQRIQDEFALATGVASIITHPDGKPLTAPSNFTRLCREIIRKTDTGCANCFRSDAAIGRYNPDGPIVQLCLSGGLWDAGASITVGGHHVANWLIGQVRDEAQTEDNMRAYAREIGADETDFLSAFQEVPTMSRTRFGQIAQALFTLARQLSTTAYQNVQQAHFIKERNRAEEIIRRERDFSQMALDSMPGLFYLFDDQGRFLRWNKNFEKVSGYSGVELSRMTPLDCIGEADREIVAAAIHRAFQTGEATVEADFLAKDRTRTPCFFTGNLFHFDRKACVIGMGIDISGRKRADDERAKLEGQLQQAQKMESIGRLAGGVAHDFNNMLGVILGHAEMVMDQLGPSNRLYADLEEIRRTANRSADLTHQLLAFARKQTIDPRILDLNVSVTGILKMLQRLIGENIRLTWQPKLDLWPVRMDPSQIDQILANLCVNARDSISGNGTLTIETGNVTFDETYGYAHADFVPGEFVRLAVSDSGCGMDKETLKHIFEPFFTTKGLGAGTGLGLAMVYGIVKQNSGFINVQSEPGKGTTFAIYLPRHVGIYEVASTEGAAGIARRGHETILLVEDEPALLRLTTRLLTKQGYTVLAASDPNAAIRIAGEHAGGIQMLVTDVIMPELNGRELAKNLQSLHPHLKTLFMSGYTADIIAHHGVLEEGVNFIQKPFTMEDLAAKVREILDRP